MTVHCVVSNEQADYQQSPQFDDLAVGEQIIVWAIRVVMDDQIPLAGRDALVEEAFLRMEMSEAANVFLEFMKSAQENSARPLITGAEYISRGELDLLKNAAAMLREKGFSI